MAVFLNSFNPLCSSKKGKQAIEKYGLSPFIDGSCRREPDFEVDNPAITSLCRPKKLIPRLVINDLVIYITNKRKYYGLGSERRLVAILQVIRLEESHCKAMVWYSQNNLNISQNIICANTKPLPADHTHHIHGMRGEVNVCIWDDAYRKRMTNYPKVAICKIWNHILNTENPPLLEDDIMKEIFGRIPGTQNPPRLSKIEWKNFQKLILNINN